MRFVKSFCLYNAYLILGSFLGSFLIAGPVSADVETSPNIKWLRDFHQNPQRAMELLAPEVVNGKLHLRGSIDYPNVEARFNERNRGRVEIISRNPNSGFPWLEPLSKMGDKDQATTLVENKIVLANIAELDRRGLTQATVPTVPWADSYWPIYKGLIADRYNDPGYPTSKSWPDYYNLSRPTGAILASNDANEINNLSPAEKYDLLVGDPNMTLTKFSWNQGQLYFDRAGHVETWMGICHGWAGAAHMNVPVIDNPIVLHTPTGLALTFYQSDIKALQSMLWANGSPSTRFSGAPCKTPRPERDAYGRVIAPECQDNNAGTFYLTLTNQLGINQRSFVMDATYDVEVWNYPIVSYTSTYFNPQTLIPTSNLSQAIIPIEKFSVDKFKMFRAAETRFVVGMFLDVTYVIEINPNHGISNKPPTKTVRYFYDLELDANQNIIGGEWYMNAHPDFLWTFDRDALASARGESAISPNEWNVSTSVPADWLPLAQRASNSGTPLSSVIRRIVESASRENRSPLNP
jgi:hypothetical protein